MLKPAMPPVSSSRRLSSTIRSAVRNPRWSPPRRLRARDGVWVVSIVIQPLGNGGSSGHDPPEREEASVTNSVIAFVTGIDTAVDRWLSSPQALAGYPEVPVPI